MQIFPIPYAGASVMVYYRWNRFLPDNYNIEFVELAGRGERRGEPFYQSVEQAAEDLSSRIVKKIKGDYVLYGHSMGALLAYEVYYKLVEKGVRLPEHCFFSGRCAPQIGHVKRNIMNLSDNDLIAFVSRYGGDLSHLADPEIRREFLPIIRSDFHILDEYVYQEKTEPIKCDISLLYGLEDPYFGQCTVEDWKTHAGHNFTDRAFSGAHFFINEQTPDVVEFIKTLCKSTTVEGLKGKQQI